MSGTDKIKFLKILNQKVLWLSSWMVHNANHLRENKDGLKVGGHQSSCASVSAIMTSLYFGILRPEDRVAVKPHAAPIFHAIQYLLGNQAKDQIRNFRAFGGAQAYPSRTKDKDDVDFSTGSVGMGVGMTLFTSLVQNYVNHQHVDPSLAHIACGFYFWERHVCSVARKYVNHQLGWVTMQQRGK